MIVEGLGKSGGVSPGGMVQWPSPEVEVVYSFLDGLWGWRWFIVAFCVAEKFKLAAAWDAGGLSDGSVKVIREVLEGQHRGISLVSEPAAWRWDQ